MMETTVLIWALWLVGGGRVNSGYLTQPYVAATFATAEECERVGKLVVAWVGNNRPHYCIQARYVGKQ
jgi:hypothetical protein